MKLKRFDHLGVVVNDLETARRLLEDGFGLHAIRDIKRPNLSATFFKCGEVDTELIEVHDAAERSQRLDPGNWIEVDAKPEVASSHPLGAEACDRCETGDRVTPELHGLGDGAIDRGVVITSSGKRSGPVDSDRAVIYITP